MKYFICTRDDVNSKALEKRIDTVLLQKGFEKNEEEAELVISLGGDGTFLRSVHHYTNKLDKVVFVGIHTGKLGFFCDYTRNEVEEFLEDLLSKQPEIIKHPLLALEYKGEKYFGLNEVRVENPYNTMICNVYINDELLENFRGNGLNFATTLGASAYNRSLGGPLIDPRLETIVMGEVASINHNAYRSLNSFLVLNKDNTIRLTGNFKRCIIGYDHHYFNIEESSKEDEIVVHLSTLEVKVLHYKDVDYFYRLRKAFVAD